MWRHRLQQFIVKSFYWYALLIGLFPAPLSRRQRLPFRRSRFYLAYSAVVHCVCVALVPLTFVALFDFPGYMQWLPVLQLSIRLTVVTKIGAFGFVLRMIWLRRQRLMDAFADYEHLVRRYRRFQIERLLCPVGCRVLRRIEWFLVGKFLTSVLSAVLMGFRSLVMHRRSFDPKLFLAAFTGFMLTTFLVTTMCQFFYALCHLYRQFASVNLALARMQRQLQGRHMLRSHAEAEQLAERLISLASMHLECYRLALRFLRLFETSLLAIIMKLFVTNVNVVYSSVLFIRGSIRASASVSLYGEALTLLFYGDCLLLIAIVDDLLNACNETGQLLRHFPDPCSQHFPCVARALEHFADHLRCHKLRYRVCGLNDFNRENSLGYFLMALVHVTVLMQFDMKDRHK